ncbi:transposon Ty3-I Gag-Pol polyprotein [Trichonephila clavipes]|nr:transposon Ty3-I Gag-Pol polyprotein [Trichonephila clavipes]
MTAGRCLLFRGEQCRTHKSRYQVPIAELAERWTELPQVSDESRSFFRVHTGYFSNIPKCIKAEFIASWACSQSSVVSSSQRWDFLEASQAVIDCGQNELVLEDICRDSTAPDTWNLYATRDYTLKPHSSTRITVSGYQTRGDINVVLDGSKHLLFEKNIATPSMVSTYRNGKSDVWVTNLQFRNQIIPRGMCIGQAEPLNEGHLCVISDTSGCLMTSKKLRSHR